MSFSLQRDFPFDSCVQGVAIGRSVSRPVAASFLTNETTHESL
jgi:hypothetical protein